jgi:15-cis-phytoene synthase
MSSLEKGIFKKGSTTYYWSSKFFPKGVRDDVFKLYSFVRVVDDTVDVIPADINRFEYICRRWQTVKKELKKGIVTKPLDDSVDEHVLANIAYIVHRYKCKPEWVDSFLESMQMDVDNRKYKSIDDTIDYIYGSAEIIGLFMVKILQLPGQGTGSTKPEPDVLRFARYQGRAMQYINFLRDIAEDIELGRCYFPERALNKHGLKDLREISAQKNPEAFSSFMYEQLSLYDEWQTEANKGFSYIPKRLLVPLKTAVDMYNWTAQEIRKNPFIVYEKQLKPKKRRVLNTAAKNTIK